MDRRLFKLLAVMFVLNLAAPCLAEDGWTEFKNAGEQAEIDTDFARSENWYGKALAEARKPGHTHAELVESMARLASAYVMQGKFDQAEPLYQSTLAMINVDRTKKQNPEELVWLDDLADAYENRCKAQISELAMKRTIEIRKQISPRHTKLAESYNHLISYYVKRREFDKALPYTEQAVALVQNTTGKQSMQTANFLLEQGNLYVGMKQYGKARDSYSKSIALMSRMGPLVPPYRSQMNRTIGETYQNEKNFRMADTCYKDALKIDSHLDGATGYLECVDLGSLANLSLDMNNFAAAEQYCQQALSLLESRAPTANQPMYDALTRYAKVLRKERKIAQAQKLEGRANALLPGHSLSVNPNNH